LELVRKIFKYGVAVLSRSNNLENTVFQVARLLRCYCHLIFKLDSLLLLCFGHICFKN